MNKNEIKKRLLELVIEINTLKHPEIGELVFHQQKIATGNMSVYLSQGIGRIYVQPSSIGCDISLSGQVIEKEMYPFMRKLFGKECDGFKQRNRNSGWDKQPFWRTDNFSKVQESIHYYVRYYSDK